MATVVLLMWVILKKKAYLQSLTIILPSHEDLKNSDIAESAY